MFEGVAFAGMMWQIPLIFLTDPLAKAKSPTAKVAGNMVFWVSFCLVGQPLAALLYFFAWQAKYGSTSKNNIAQAK
jgi:diacylglycerol O-acyltransferase-1